MPASTTGILAAQEPGLANPASRPAKLRVQLAILLDTSGGMEGLIDQARTQLGPVANELVRVRKGGAHARPRGRPLRLRQELNENAVGGGNPAQRALFAAGGLHQEGSQDLVDAWRSGKIKLDTLKQSDLSAEMRMMDGAARPAFREQASGRGFTFE